MTPPWLSRGIRPLVWIPLSLQFLNHDWRPFAQAFARALASAADAAPREVDRMSALESHQAVATILALAEKAGLLKDKGRAASLLDADRIFKDLQAYSRSVYDEPQRRLRRQRA